MNCYENLQIFHDFHSRRCAFSCEMLEFNFVGGDSSVRLVTFGYPLRFSFDSQMRNASSINLMSFAIG